MLLKTTTDGGTTEITAAGNTTFIPLISPPEKVYDTGYPYGAIRYSFAIPKDYISTGFNAIGLYPMYTKADAGDITSYSACCTVPDELLDSFSGQVNAAILRVDWDLMFTNTNDTNYQAYAANVTTNGGR
jgi:hypothetical protein